MSKINWWRVLGCGLLAGIVWIILGSLVTSLLGREFAALPNNHLRAPTASFLVVNVVLDLLEGIYSLALCGHPPTLWPRCENRWHRGIRVVVYRQPGRRTWCSFGFFPPHTVVPLMIGTLPAIYSLHSLEPGFTKIDPIWDSDWHSYCSPLLVQIVISLMRLGSNCQLTGDPSVTQSSVRFGRFPRRTFVKRKYWRQYGRNPCGQLRKEKTPTLAQVMAATREACVVPRRVTVIFEILQPRERRSHGRSTTQPRIALPTHPPTAAWSNARSHVSVHRAKFVLHVPVQAEGEVTAGRAVHYATSLENAPATSWRTVCIPIRTLRDHRLHSLLSSDPWLPPAARIRRQRVQSINR